MAQTKRCEGCSQTRDCKDAYRQLGCAEGPSVAPGALVAFLLPILLFTIGLGGFGQVLDPVVGRPYRMPLAVLLALTATTVLMWVGRSALRQYRNRRIPEQKV